MKILFDENIPYAEAFFSSLGECHAFHGRDLSPAKAREADILLVRSITQVNRELLGDNPNTRFVGTATIGTDHVDRAYLAEHSIPFSNAPGGNAQSVADYVLSSVLVLAQKYQWQLDALSIGVIGAGNIGSKVAIWAEALGMNVLLCDPPLEEAGDTREFVSLEQAMQADIISLHVPLIRTGSHPSYMMFDKARLAMLGKGQTLINTCRGDVVDNQALLALMKSGKALNLVMDVWQNEPNVLNELISYAQLSTAHIAGYSLEGKAKGTEILYRKVCELLKEPVQHQLDELLPQPEIQETRVQGELSLHGLTGLVHSVYDVRRDDGLFRQHGASAKGFDTLRKHYPQRRELGSLAVISDHEATLSTMSQLGFKAGTRGDS